jgi:hypothetical protein
MSSWMVRVEFSLPGRVGIRAHIDIPGCCIGARIVVVVHDALNPQRLVNVRRLQNRGPTLDPHSKQAQVDIFVAKRVHGQGLVRVREHGQ